LITAFGSGLLSCRSQAVMDEPIIDQQTTVKSSFGISYRLYQTRPGYGNFEDLKPTERFRQFVRNNSDKDRDYLFELQAPASANDPRVVVTLSKTSFQAPHRREVVFRFFVPKAHLIKPPKSSCHFGYTRQTKNCDVYSEVRSTSEYPFLPASFQNPPVRCTFKLLSETLDWKKLFHQVSWENPVSLILPTDSTHPEENPSIQFRFKCQDLRNKILAADGYFSTIPAAEAQLMSQSEFHPED